MLDLLKSRRSIRKYDNRPVEKEKIDELLKAALLSPSSRARRPWEFIAVTDGEILSQLSKCRGASSAFLAGATLGIVVLCDSSLCDVWIEDASISATIIQLTAHSLGLGSCWIQVRERMHKDEVKAEDYIKKLLKVPEKYNVECIISLGYSAEEKEEYAEEDLIYSKLHYDRF